jgi:stage V sporulation protein B
MPTSARKAKRQPFAPGGIVKGSGVRVGTMYLLVAQMTFLVSGYVMHIFLGRYLGPVEYGLFGVVLYAANISRAFVSAGIPMAVTRYISAKPEAAEAVYRTGFKAQFILSLAISLLVFAFAEPLARLLGDMQLVVLFRLGAPLTLFFALFFLVMQYYNGLRSYRPQSIQLTISYLLRLGLVILLVAAGFRVVGAVAGLVLASAIAALWALLARKAGPASEPFPLSTLIAFSAPLVLSAIAQALLTDLDIMFVKRLIPENTAAGLYTSAKALALVTPFAFYALSGALYPAVSSAHSSGDKALLKRYIQQANRLLLIVILPLVVIIACDAPAVMLLVYGKNYLEAAVTLRWLMPAFGLMSVFIIHKTIITGCGYPKIDAALTLAILPLCILLQMILVPALGLPGAALASAGAFAVAAICSLTILLVKFGAGFKPSSTLRIFAAAAALLLFEFIFSFLSLPFLLKLPLLSGLYAFMIWRVGELRLGDIKEMAARFGARNDL